MGVTKTFGKKILAAAALGCFLVTSSVGQAAGEEKTGENDPGMTAKGDKAESTAQEKKYSPVYPEETESGTSSTPMIILGGALAVGVAALALGGGGSSDDSTAETGGGTGSDPASSTSTGCAVSDVGPSIAGNDWSGRLRLINYGSQSVTATITQCGRKITIFTNTALHHGRSFSGSISSGGDVHVADSTTNQIWTTFKGSASSRSLRIYDYVNKQTALDSLELSR